MAAESESEAVKEDSSDETETDDGNVITITGMRSSQRKALADKRDATSIIDSIAAEDLGKFPDQNISESLQRIPGITISRVGGEGQQVTVRGMGPEHTTVLLNGRVLATENEGREFNFDVLASELMTGLDVYKTPTASLEEGGIGSTINMKTAKPMDYEGFQAVAAIKGHYDENSGETSPQFSGLMSNTFMDDRLGILASINFYEHEFRSDRVYTDGYEHFQSSNFSNLSQARRDELSVYDGDGYGEGIAMATWYQEDIDRASRKRIGGTLAVQYEANDDLLFTVDGIYSKLDVNSRAFGPAKWIGPGNLDDVTVNSNGTVVGFSGTTPWGGPENWSFSRPRFAETKQIGINVDWRTSDQLTMVFDASYSTATSTPIGREVIVSIAADGLDLARTTPSGIIPTYTFTNGDAGNLSTLKPNWAATEGTDLDDTSKSAAIDATYEMNGDSVVTSILAGVSVNSREKVKIRAGTGDGGISCGATCDNNGGFYPSNLFSAFDSGDFFDGSSAFSSWVFPDFDAINDILDDSPGFITKVRPRESGTVKEETFGGYIQANLIGYFGDMPWSGNVGLRYAQTDVSSIGENEELLSVDKTDPNEPVGVFSPASDIKDTGDYDIWLPSVNFKVNLQDDLALRAAIGKTITRPTLSLLQLKREWNLRPNDRILVTGNPSLEPLIAWNYDVNMTWYIDDVSYLSAAVFYKDLSNDWQESRTTEVFFGDEYTVISTENRGEGDKTGYELSGQYTFSELPAPFNGLGVAANYTEVTSGSDDPDVDADDDSISYNFSLFYEQGAVQARIAYNFRDGYLAALNGNRGQPRHIDDYGQFDIQGSYNVTDNLVIFAEGINITNEKTLSFSIYKERVIELKDTGRRYALGVRYKF